MHTHRSAAGAAILDNFIYVVGTAAIVAAVAAACCCLPGSLSRVLVCMCGRVRGEWRGWHSELVSPFGADSDLIVHWQQHACAKRTYRLDIHVWAKTQGGLVHAAEVGGVGLRCRCSPEVNICHTCACTSMCM